ncbi:DUF406 family protein [Vibrio sp. S9_S30]|uniref:YfcZ/YiiS family protein n=1 Tax=Vibrio sp. S9_S30 TaxID=2720226 RepID=UPI00168065B0|nr:YfcZ/YiiS family protein [Vibrio sp. S9_S30]MBD1558763.1 DUF406 family protein [Vibrio sp. S9_S30]
MTTKAEDNQVCEACGCSAEMGFIIKEGDDVANISLFGRDFAALESELNKYIDLANTVSNEVKYESQRLEDEAGIETRFQFTCSAEKLIFELKTRTLAR